MFHNIRACKNSNDDHLSYRSLTVLLLLSFLQTLQVNTKFKCILYDSRVYVECAHIITSRTHKTMSEDPSKRNAIILKSCTRAYYMDKRHSVFSAYKTVPFFSEMTLLLLFHIIRRLWRIALTRTRHFRGILFECTTSYYVPRRQVYTNMSNRSSVASVRV